MAGETVGNIPFAMLTLDGRLFKVEVRPQQKLEAKLGVGGHLCMGLFRETTVCNYKKLSTLRESIIHAQRQETASSISDLLYSPSGT